MLFATQDMTMQQFWHFGSPRNSGSIADNIITWEANGTPGNTLRDGDYDDKRA